MIIIIITIGTLILFFIINGIGQHIIETDRKRRGPRIGTTEYIKLMKNKGF